MRHNFPYVERLILPLDTHVGQPSRLDLVPDLAVDILGDGDPSVMTNDCGPLDLLAEYVLLPQRAVAKETKLYYPEPDAYLQLCVVGDTPSTHDRGVGLPHAQGTLHNVRLGSSRKQAQQTITKVLEDLATVLNDDVP
jgi:hypothetical protein